MTAADRVLPDVRERRGGLRHTAAKFGSWPGLLHLGERDTCVCGAQEVAGVASGLVLSVFCAGASGFPGRCAFRGAASAFPGSGCFAWSAMPGMFA
jgi:hypothetical protein